MCPRLNKRCRETQEVKEGLKEAENILNDVINGVFENISAEFNIESEAEVTSKKKVPEYWWTCPVCSAKVKHKQNIHRHQALNCKAVKLFQV